MFWRIFRRKQKTFVPVIANVVDDDYVKDFCYEWSIKYPVDRWWRNKHNVAFNSLEHRGVSFIDMRIEYEEEQMFLKADKASGYKPNMGDWLNDDLIYNESETVINDKVKKDWIEEGRDILKNLEQFNDPK